MRLKVETLEAAKNRFYKIGKHKFIGSYFGIRCDFCGKTKYIEGRCLLRKLDDDHYKCGDCVQREQNEKMRRRIYHSTKKSETNTVVIEDTERKNPMESNLEKYGGRIVVTMTSWKKRIGNCVKVIKTALNQTVKPDTVYLNLSSEEFKNKEDDLPKDLILLRDENEKVIINWVDGENTKTMKKVFPILRYLNDEDFIINTDDDTLMPKDLIESRMKEWRKYKKPITACNNPNRHYHKEIDGYACGPCSLLKKKMLNGWEMMLSDDVIHTYCDDNVYACILYLNGYKFKPCETYSRHTGVSQKKLKVFNDKEPMGKNNQYSRWSHVRKAVEKRLSEISKFNTIQNAYGCMMKKVDFVIPYTLSAKKADSVAISKFERLEIEYVLKSIRKFCAWSGRIFVATDSELPKRILDQVTVIKVGDPYTHIKDANIINKIKTVIERVPDLSETFIMASDDQVVTKPSIISDFYPRISSDYTGNIQRYKNVIYAAQQGSPTRKWRTSMYHTLNKFKNRAYFYEPHIWTRLNKEKFSDMCRHYDIAHDDGIVIFTLYNNYTEQQNRPNRDHTYLSNACTTTEIIGAIKRHTRHLSWTDTAFKNKKFRDHLEKLLFCE